MHIISIVCLNHQFLSVMLPVGCNVDEFTQNPLSGLLYVVQCPFQTHKEAHTSSVFYF